MGASAVSKPAGTSADSECRITDRSGGSAALLVASAASWRVVRRIRLLGVGVGGSLAALTLSDDPKRAALAFGVGTAAFGGFTFLFHLSASDLTRLEPRNVDPLPPDVTHVGTSRLLVPSWRIAFALIAPLAVAYLLGGPVMTALVSGFAIGLLLGGLPMEATLTWHERRNRSELFVEIERRRPQRQIYERRLGT